MLERPGHWTSRLRLAILASMGALDPFPPPDPLGEALHFLRMNGAFYCRSELTAPWGLTLPPMPGYVWFHVVTSGRFWLEAGESEPAWLGSATSRWCLTGRGTCCAANPGLPPRGSSISSASSSATATRSFVMATAARRPR